MSREVEERVVEMRFDNQQFESRAGKTIGTLQELKNALNFKSATTGIDEINKSVDKVNMNPLTASVQSVQKSFSALEAMALGALMNIGKRAVDTGINLVKSLSVDQIDSGFKEYELKMGSIQTIMASTGEDLDTVNGYLEELNHYADKTIYSFSDMTSNIGKFTNAGVGLEQAVKAIQGISNEAAVSGANANEASRAMYNFAQALSAGYVKLIDWKSIENANMATVEFKQQLIETAEAMGTIVKKENGWVSTTKDLNGKVSDAFNATRNFNDSLSHQWMTTDVLVQTLNNYSTDIREMTVDEIKAYEAKLKSIGYTDEQIKKIEELGKKAFDAAQDVKTFSQLLDTLKESVGSGWAQTFELILGNFEQAKAMWTAVNNEIGGILQASSDKRNQIIKEAFSKNNLADVISMMSGSSLESIQELRELGDEVGTNSEKFHDFALQVAHGDDALASLITHLIQMVDGTQSLNGYLIENTGITQENIDEAKRLGAEYGFTSKEFEDYIKEISNGDAALESFLTHSLDMTSNQTDTITYLSKMTGATQDYINHLWELGRAGDYSSEEFNKLADEITGGDEAMKKLIVSMFKLTDATAPYTDILSYVADTAGVSREAIEELDKLGQEAGYTSEEFRKLALEIANGDEVLADLITGLLTTDFQSGRDLFLQAISNVYKALKRLASIASQAWKEVFPEITSDSLYSAIRALNEFTKKLTISEELAEKLGNTFKGLFSILGIVFDVIKEVANFLLEKFGKRIKDTTGNVLSLTSSIGSCISNFRDWLKENQIIRKALDKISESIVKIIDTVKDWIADFKELEWVQDFLEQADELVTKIVNGIIDLFPTASERVQDLGNAIYNLASTRNFDDLYAKIKDFARALKTDLTGAVQKFMARLPYLDQDLASIGESIVSLNPDKLPSWAKGVYDTIKLALSPAIAIFGGFYESLTDSVPSISRLLNTLNKALGVAAFYIGDHLGTIAAAALMFVTGRSLWKLTNSLIGIAKAVTSPITSITTAFNSMSKAFKGMAKVFNALAFVEIVAGVVALANVAVKLGDVPEEKLKQGVTAVLELAGVIGAIIFLLERLQTAKNAKVAKIPEIKNGVNFLTEVLKLAGAVALVAAAFWIVKEAIHGASEEEIEKAIQITVGAIGAMLSATVIIMGISKIPGASILSGSATTILAMAFAFMLIASTLKDLIDAMRGVTLTRLDKLIDIVGSAYMGMAAVMFALSRAKVSWNATGAIISIGITMKLLVDTLSEIKDLNVDRWNEGQWHSLLLVVALLGALIFGITKMKAGSKDAALSLAAAAIAIRLLAGTIGIIGMMQPGTILKGVLAIGALLIFLGLFVKLADSKYGNLNGKVALVLMALAFTLAILTGAIVLMGLLDPMSVMIGTAAISVLLGFLALVLAASHLAKGVDPKIFVNLAILIGVLAASIVVIGMMSPDQVLVGVAAMAALMTFMFFLTIAMGMLQGVDSGPILSLAVVVAALAASIYVIGQLDPGQVAVATLALDSVMGMFTVLTLVIGIISKSLGKDKNGTKNILTVLIGMTVIIAAIGLVIGLLVSLTNPVYAVMIANAISELMKSLSVAMVGVSLLGHMDTNGIIRGIGGAILLFLAFGTLSGVLGMLNEYMPGLKDWIERGFPLMRALGQSIGELIGGVLDGILGGSIQGIIDSLIEFSDGLSVFVENVKGMDESAVNGVKAMVELVLAMAGANLMDAITNLLGGDRTSLAEFGAQLVLFGPSLAVFSATVKDVDGEAVQQAADAAKSLAELANNLPTSGGWKAKILGDQTSLDEFAVSIIMFARGLVGFCDVIAASTNFNPDLIAQCATAASSLVDLVNNMPESGGWKQKILGEPATLESFGSSLVTFGTYMNEFLTDSKGISGIKDYTVIDSLISATQKLVDLQAVLPEKDGLIDTIFGGEYDLDTFGAQIKKYGQHMADFFSEVSTVTSTSQTDNAITITTNLMTMAGETFMENGTTLVEAADAINDFGYDLNVFWTKIRDIDADHMSLVLTEVSKLLSIMRGAKEFTSDSLSGFASSLETIANTSLDSFETVFISSGDAVASSIQTMLTYATMELTATIPIFEQGGVDIGNAFIMGLKSSTAEIQGVSITIVGVFLEGLTSKNFSGGPIYKAGQDATSSYQLGLASKTNAIVETAKNIIDFMVRTLNEMIGDARLAGNNFGEAFVVNVNAYKYSAYTAAWNVGRSAVNGLQEAIDSHSPSKETQKLGEYAGIGFVNSLLDWVAKARDAGTLVGESSLNGLAETIRNIPKIISEDFNMSPVIRPTLDLGDVEQSAGYLNDLFNASVGVSAANVSTVSAYADPVRVRATYGDEAVNQQAQSATNPVYITNTFNITSNNPEEVANRTSRIIQRQVERKGSAWAQSFGTAVPQTR